MLDVTNTKGRTMSTTPWGTMNGWLRVETEQRGAWLQQRVQDLRAARVAGLPAVTPVRTAPEPVRVPACVDVDRTAAAA